MKVIPCQQGSPEWLQARCGIPTASEFGIYRHRVGELTEQQATYVNAQLILGKTETVAREMAGYKAKPRSESIERALAGLPVGDHSPAAKNAAFKKAMERIGNKLIGDGEGYENWGQRRGHELEPAARREHEIQLGEVVHTCGFVTTDDGMRGASLDGMIGYRLGGAEYKCFASPDRIRTIILDGDLSEVIEQVQGCIDIAELQWLDFCLYCPELEPAGNTLWHRRVFRDDVFIAAQRADLERFELLIQDYMVRIRAAMTAPMTTARISAPAPEEPPSAPAAAPQPQRAAEPPVLVDNPF